MPTVASLIEQLQTLNPDEPIVYQYMLAEHTGDVQPEFAKISEYLAENTAFAESVVEFFRNWIDEAADVLFAVEEDEK
jgi:hypothetical protein